MTDFDRLIDRYRQFGGIKLAWAYMKMGLTWPLLKAIFSCVVKGRSLKNVYPVIQSRTQPMLVDMLSPIAHSLYEKYSGDRCAYTGNTSGERKKVWFCWLQGIEHSPALVKACLESLRERLTDADIVIIDGESYKEWIGLPEYVTEKYRNGKIPPALFSDMIRLELLAEYGGVWIDSTVLCTVPSSDEHGQHAPSWREITEAELFVFQYTKPGYKWSGSISNWFIGANRDNIIIKMVRDMLYEYWRVYDVTIDYYIFHLFFAIAARECPDMIRRMPYGWSIPCITLGEHLEEDFSENKWEKFTRKVHWHKLNYRNEKRMKGNKKSYYNYIIDRYIPYKKIKLQDMQVIITAPSLDTKKNVSGVSSVVRFIIDNNPGRRYIHFELGRQDNERRGPRRLLSLTKALWEWKKLLSKNTEAMVHYSFPLSTPSILRDPLFMWTAKRKGHRMVVHIHGGLFLNAERTPWLLRKILKWVFSWDVPFIVLSDKEREILMDKFSAKNVEILPNCVSIPEEDNYTHKEQRRHDGIIMGYLGRIEGNKGMRELLEACKRLKEEGVDFKLRFAGKEQKEGEFIPEYKNALGGNFEYVGLVSGKTKELFMRSLDIFIMPTYFEGLPMSLLECMSYAITPVVTPVGSIPTVVDSIDTTTRDVSGKYNLEAVTEGMDGVFIKKQDVRSIIDAVKLLYENREMTRKLGLNARKRIIQEFSPNEYIEKLNSIYTKANLRT